MKIIEQVIYTKNLMKKCEEFALPLSHQLTEMTERSHDENEQKNDFVKKTNVKSINFVNILLLIQRK